MSYTAHHWVVTASADHAARGRAEAIVQANHGKSAPLRRMRPGDGVVIYSPRSTYPDGPALQAFTLIGRVADAAPYAHELGHHVMWRRPVLWAEATSAPIRPLLPQLHLTMHLPAWGMAFRYGLSPLSQQDFDLIAQAMQARFADHAQAPLQPLPLRTGPNTHHPEPVGACARGEKKPRAEGAQFINRRHP